MSDFRINVGAPFPSLLVQLEANGSPVDLTGCIITFTLAKHGHKVVNAVATTIVTAALGIVRQDFTTTSIQEEGFYRGQFAVAFPPAPSASTTQFFPAEPIVFEVIQL